jgi:hypothetical protein
VVVWRCACFLSTLCRGRERSARVTPVCVCGCVLASAQCRPSVGWRGVGGVREQVVRILKGHTDWVRAVVVCPSGRFLYSGGGLDSDLDSDNCAIVHWNLDSGQVCSCAVP